MGEIFCSRVMFVVRSVLIEQVVIILSHSHPPNTSGFTGCSVSRQCSRYELIDVNQPVYAWQLYSQQASRPVQAIYEIVK